MEKRANAKNVCMNEKEESTHFVLDGKQIQVSTNLVKVASFLIEIEKESEAVFGVEKRLSEFRDYYRDLLDCTSELSRVLKENNIDDWSYTFKKDPRNFTDLLQYHVPVRTQMILLFTQLEVLFFLYIAYTKEIDSEIELREVAMKDEKFRKTFTRDFILSENNDFFKQNIKRFRKLDAGKIIRLRNSLVHFFSLSSDAIGINTEQFQNDAKKFEKHAADNRYGSFIMMSPTELHELIKGAYTILFRKWSQDTCNDNLNFKRKIKFVNNIVSEYGAVVVYYNEKKENS
jgi:hypothetical protein